jgi:hypothetical protein
LSLWLLAVKKKKPFLLLQQWSKHQHLLLLQLPMLQPLTLLLLLQPPMLQPLLLLTLLLLQLSNLRFNLKLFVKKPTFGLAFSCPEHFDILVDYISIQSNPCS